MKLKSIVFFCLLTSSISLVAFNVWPFNKVAKQIEALDEKIAAEQRNLRWKYLHYVINSANPCAADPDKLTQQCREYAYLQQFFDQCIKNSNHCEYDLRNAQNLNLKELTQVIESMKRIAQLEKQKQELAISVEKCPFKKKATKLALDSIKESSKLPYRG